VAQGFEERFLAGLEGEGSGEFLSVRKVDRQFGEKQHGPFSV